MTAQPPATRFRALLDGDGLVALPGVHDALSARLAERAGFEALFTSGFGIAASTLGLPDLGLMSMAENVDRIDRIAGSVDVPLVADADTGYGSALNVRRTVGECLDAGVAGVILEDQAWPKRCGHMDEKRVVSEQEGVRRIRAAADVREERDSDLVIIGRTDARATDGLDEAIERGRSFADAGADVVFVEAPESRGELERIASEVEAPTFANMVEGGKTPVLSAAELDEIGFDVAVYPLSALFAATKAMADAYETLADEGTTESVDGVTFDEFEAVVDADGYRELERRYADDGE
ncbi:isocitrate lyase/PEP mutase family protein [Halorientalis halophila]|uniref:isocitrate lyase/PEP mutase family protein n=1 Tax=Halorientalis halophila TaxID=3108499 RepID=UPI00300BD09A